MKSKFIYAVETYDDIHRISRKKYRDNRNFLLKSKNCSAMISKTLNEETIAVFTGNPRCYAFCLLKVLKSSIKE